MKAAAGETGAIRAFWQAPHRPLFSAAILYALLTVGWWPLGVEFGLPLPGFEPVVLWHVHELTFGFAGAAIGGYLLTALPSWTGCPPVQGAGLVTLLILWLSARLAMALTYFTPIWLIIALNFGYFLLLALVVGFQLVKNGACHKIVFVFAVVGLGCGEVAFLTTATNASPWDSLTYAPTLLIGIGMLMGGVGMRAIPAFTNNWFALFSRPYRARTASDLLMRLVQGLLATAIVAFFAGLHDIAFISMITAALTILWGMRGWRMTRAFPNPLLAALHLSFLWLPLGLIAVGVSGLAHAVYPMSDALHAISIGAMSGLIMAIGGRAAAHTEDDNMKANACIAIGVALIWVTTWMRLMAPLIPDLPAVQLAAATWCIAWIAFAVGFLPALTGPLRRPALSGRRYSKPENDMSKMPPQRVHRDNQ